MSQQPVQSGAKVPTSDAVRIMNENAAAVAQRSRLATSVAAQYRVGRDALRRDAVIRTPSAQELAGLQTVKDVPQDQAPTQQDIPNDLIQNLVNQFRGTGGTGGGGSGGGGGGGGTHINPGNPGAPPDSGGSVGGGGGTGVQTFTGDPGATFIGQSGNGGWKPTGITQPGSPPYGSHGYGAQYKYQNGSWWYKFPWE